MVVTAAGRVKHAEVLELAERAFAAAARRAAPPPRAPPAARRRKGPRLHFVSHDEAQTEFRLNFRTVPEQHEDFPALQLLRRVLDDGLSSRLPFEVVEKRGLAYSINAGLEAFHDVGVFEIEGGERAREGRRGWWRRCCRVLATLCVGGGLRRGARARQAPAPHAAWSSRQDSPGELAGWFGGTELFRTPGVLRASARTWWTRETAAHVREVARRYFTRENLTVVAVGQRKGIKALERVVERAEGLPSAGSEAGQRCRPPPRMMTGPVNFFFTGAGASAALRATYSGLPGSRCSSSSTILRPRSVLVLFSRVHLRERHLLLERGLAQLVEPLQGLPARRPSRRPPAACATCARAREGSADRR